MPSIWPASDRVPFSIVISPITSSLETRFPTTFDLAVGRHSQIKETDPTGYYPGWADGPSSDHSRRPTGRRSGVIDSSLESCDPTLQCRPIVKGVMLKGAPTLNFSPLSDFIQSARPLARLGSAFNGTPQKAVFLLFPMELTPSTFLNSFPSYPTFR